MTDTDLELLSRYCRRKDEDAFAEVVRRHLGLVYSAALRQVHAPPLAEEVAQAVFVELARQSSRLAPDTILPAWLYTVTHRAALNVMRGEFRRQSRERIASERHAMNTADANWAHIEPLLDEAMRALDDTDRAAVLLRYFLCAKSARPSGRVMTPRKSASAAPSNVCANSFPGTASRSAPAAWPPSSPPTPSRRHRSGWPLASPAPRFWPERRFRARALLRQRKPSP